MGMGMLPPLFSLPVDAFDSATKAVVVGLLASS
uniref:Uncharacterized protein n=1 Tax=Arundo donax TaxID=35708 RepID=A0A0A9H2I0_ARUDO